MDSDDRFGKKEAQNAPRLACMLDGVVADSGSVNYWTICEYDKLDNLIAVWIQRHASQILAIIQ
jgi:hypothetical protein